MGAKSTDAVTVLVFLNTEFTDFVKPDLISIALVAQDGWEFYAECTDYRHTDCNDFVRATVLPLLGRVHGAACSRSKLTIRLHRWFDSLPEPAIIVYDFETDWRLLADAMLGHAYSNPPANFGEPLHLGNSSITHPVFTRALNNIYTQDWPPHHALADARALKARYRA
jgi:hypothetical protein